MNKVVTVPKIPTASDPFLIYALSGFLAAPEKAGKLQIEIAQDVLRECESKPSIKKSN